ncbi:glycosyltransferase family 2 protein [Kiloniella antarctica]|uniref:Glycosyltransferase family 2 protein n=1 Tax=Kiloniella antarctica TaxID=1550907 RepID=A0ABW5BR42_9PROT
MSKVEDNKNQIKIRLNKPRNEIRIVVVTPTCNRVKFLQQAHRYFRNQNYPYPENLFWCILDDSKQKPNTLFHASLSSSPNICYVHCKEKLLIGRKRNILNNMAVRLDADIVCAMDDDDWYGPNYVAEMVELLMTSDFPLAGGSAVYFYVVGEDRIIHFNRPFGSYHSCNGLMAYKAELLKYTSYDDEKATGEEMGFTKGFKIPLKQHPVTKRVFLGLVHPANTVSKDFIVKNEKYKTDLTLEDFSIDESTKAFLRAL